MVGGSYLLKQFTSIRYDVAMHKRTAGASQEELKKIKMTSGEKRSLEEEWARMQSTMGDTDNWKNIRGARPWEEPTPEWTEMQKNKRQEAERAKAARLAEAKMPRRPADRAVAEQMQQLKKQEKPDQQDR